MQKIILSADSTCDLDKELKERYHVNYFPLHINLNGKDYLDNVDITPEQIYQEYFDHKVLPKTSAVNVQEYIDHFRPWVEAGYEVIHVNLGHALSSSYQNCCLAAQELGHVHVVDSCNLSTGTGLTVVAAGYPDIPPRRRTLFGSRRPGRKYAETKALHPGGQQRRKHERW